MKNIIKIIFLLSILLLVFACPEKDSTKPPTVYTNNIDVRFVGNWDLYSCSEENGTKYFYPVLMQKNYIVASNDSLVINSDLVGGDNNHGVFFYDGQIGYIDKDENPIYLYDFYYNKDLNRIWMKADTSRVATLNFDPALDTQDTTMTISDYMLLYPSTQPPAPKLTSPEDKTEIGELKPTLTWEAFSGAENYQIQISTDSLFAQLIIDETVNNTTYGISENLTNFATFYWRVKANNSVWSTVYKFSTFYIVSLRQPGNAASTSRKPTIKWDAYEGATNYQVQISLVPDFSNTLYNETLEQTEWIPNQPLEPQKRYYWRVKADNSEGNWSLVRSFITDGYIILQSPENGHTGETVESIYFEWQPIENASTYHIQIADSLTENEELYNIIVDVDNITTTSYTSENQLEENKTYYWRVSSDVSGRWSYVYVFVTNNSVFLRSPENNSSEMPLIVKFDWDKLSDQDENYTLQISTDQNFTDYYENITENTEYILTTYLESNTQYYWRVRADVGEWSDVWTFTTAPINSGTMIEAPANGATSVAQKPNFSWGEITGSSYYQLMISESPEFVTTVLDTVIDATDNTYKPTTPLAFNATYYWRVRSDVSLWSSANSFTVESGIPSNFIVEATSPLKFDIRWTNTASRPLGYVLERWDSETQEWTMLVDETDLQYNLKNDYVDFDKNPNVYYKYRIKAVSENGDSQYAVYPQEGEGIQPMALSSIDIPELVDVQAGSFDMGSTSGDEDEAPIHNVTLTNDFKMAKYETTISEFVQVLNYALGKGYIKYSSNYTENYYTEDYYNYASNAIPITNLFVSSTPFVFDEHEHKFVCVQSNANKPIYDVTYFAAVLYCQALNEIEGYDGFYNISSSSISSDPYNGMGYRLPTEAEWEYVAKYNDGRTYPWGETDPDEDHANYYGSGWGNEPINVDACSAGVNQLGIYNMAGNVWEWCNDTYGEYTSDSQTDPTGPTGTTTTTKYKIIRGSSCEMGPNYLRTANRSYCKANLQAGKVNSMIGFRIIKLQ